MESEEHEAVMLGRVDEETVFVNDTYLVIWSLKEGRVGNTWPSSRSERTNA